MVPFLFAPQSNLCPFRLSRLHPCPSDRLISFQNPLFHVKPFLHSIGMAFPHLHGRPMYQNPPCVDLPASDNIDIVALSVIETYCLSECTRSFIDPQWWFNHIIAAHILVRIGYTPKSIPGGLEWSPCFSCLVVR